MARPKGSTREKVLMRDAYKASLLATAERAISGDQKAQEVFLSAIGVPHIRILDWKPKTQYSTGHSHAPKAVH